MRINRMERLSKEQARIRYPDYHNYPSIHITGSIRGMRELYNWRGLVIRVGSYYYLIGG